MQLCQVQLLPERQRLENIIRIEVLKRVVVVEAWPVSAIELFRVEIGSLIIQRYYSSWFLLVCWLLLINIYISINNNNNERGLLAEGWSRPKKRKRKHSL